MPFFFHSITIDAQQAERFAEAVRQLRREELHGILVRRVYSAEECAGFVARFEAGGAGLFRTDFPPLMRAYFLGMNLNLAPSDLAEYFRAAPEFSVRLKALFAGSADLETRLSGLLSALDGGRRYCAAPGPRPGLDHMFTTLRAHLTGGFIPPHFDNEQGFRQSYRFIMPHIGTDLFSFVLAFSCPEAGGELEIFDLQHEGRPFRMMDGEQDASHLNLTGVESVRFRLEPGELIIFNSGRYLHRVNRVAGAATRWTACSFMAESRGGDRVYCWG